MERSEFIQKLTTLIPEYIISPDSNDSILLTKEVNPIEYRTSDKTLIKSGNTRYIFISDLMYKDRPDIPKFHYITIYTKGQIRYFRCKSFIDIELDKYYHSGKNYDELLKRLTKAKENNEL